MFAPVESGEKRIELGLEGEEAVIRLSSWVDGLGWCGEKTVRADADLLDEMHRLIGAARVQLRRRKMDKGEGVAAHKVLNFPVAT